MKLKHLMAATMLTFSLAAAAHVNECNNHIPNVMETNIIDSYDYAKAWKEVEKLDHDLKPREALEKVKEIRQNALKEKNYQQASRAFIYSIDYSIRVEESTNWKDEIKLLRTAANDAPDAPKAFLNLLLGRYYSQYSNSSAYRKRDRTEVENDQSDDIETWSPSKIDRAAAECFRNAVANPKATQSVPLDNWKDAIVRSEKDADNTLYCKTLYDFIAWNVIDYYCTRNHDGGDFSFKDLELISDADKFVNFQPKNEDTWSSENLRLSIYQELLRAHKNDKTPIAYAFTDLFRLQYYSSNSVSEDAPDVYLKTLQSIKSRYTNDPETYPHVTFRIAAEYKKRNMLKEAHDIAAEAYKKFPKSSSNFGEACNTIARELELKSLSFQSEKIVAANTPFPMRLNYTNLPKVYLHIYKVDNLDDYNHNSYDRVEYIKNKLTEVAQREITLIDQKDYQPLNSEIIMDGLPNGNYVILGSNDKDYAPKKSDVVAYLMVKVTNIAVVTMTEKIGHRKFYVVDRTTGRGIPSAKVTLYSNDKAVWDATTNADGVADMDIKQINFRYWNTTVTVTLQDGDETDFSDYFSYDEPDTKKRIAGVFFTDRKIYRPGQTLYFKEIIYDGNGKDATVKPNFKTKIELIDVNHKVVAFKELTTNEFGSVHGEFTLPVGLANGRFTLRDNETGQYHFFNIEEYKRPTFEVKINDPEGEVKLNDKVTLNGSAATYAGTKIANGKVRYEVTRIPEWRGWWNWNYNYTERIIESGETTTDDEGSFKVTFTAKPDANAKESEYLVYNYRVKISVTDTNGETREASTITSAGFKSMFISVSMPSGFNIMDKAKLNESTVHCNSANGSPLTADVNIKISRLANYDKPRLSKPWASCDNPLQDVTREIWDSKLPNLQYSKADNNIDSLKVEKAIKTLQVHCTDGEGKVDLSFLQKEGSGHYLVEIESKDREGRPVKYQRRFTVYNPKDEITKVNTVFFSDVDKSSYEPGETAIVTMGSALSGLKVRYQVQCGVDIVESGVKTLDRSVEKITIPIKENMRGGLSVKMFYVINNQFEDMSEGISVPYTNKKLNAKFEVFRDKLYPGDTEKWKIRITDYQDKAVRAEFAATLFDASINTLASNYWYLNAYSSNYNSSYYDTHTFGSTNASVFTGVNNRSLYATTNTSHPVINWYGHEPRFSGEYMLYDYMPSKAVNGRGIVESAPMMLQKSAVMDEAVLEEEEVSADYEAANDVASTGSEDGGEDFSNAEIRTNFAETAFFKPDIVTDYNGDLFVEFTVPQSITRWKMLGIAHTKDLAVGSLTNELVTNKDFSIIPNLPRFMRCGDKVEIPIKISNLGENDVVRGQIKMEVLDVETMRSIRQFKIWEPLQAFEVFKGKTEATKYIVDVPQYEKPVAIRIVGVSGNHSDGEQHIIPILTDKTLVTEALTLSVRGNETKTFEFKNWTNSTSTTAIDHSLTLEYSSNPAWYAVSSLPWLSQNPYDCYEQTFSKLFANSVSKLILDNNPEIPTILTKWLNDNSQVLTSPLLKNQELKTILIDETPWAIDGNNETERMHNLCELLDANRIATENEKFIKKLSEGQMSSGAWPWFAGMIESPWITQHITAGFGKLRHIGVDINRDPRITQMLDRAIRYLDEETAKYFETYIKKNQSAPGYYGYQYLYMRSFFPEYKLTRAKEAYDYYLKYAREHWQDFGLYYQAVLCTVMKRTGNSDISQKIIESFRDRAQRSDEFGMYFNENVNGYLWHEHNIETQAMIAEAFQAMGTKEEVEELKIWLIKNRQSNRWATTKATTEACYAMFLCGNRIKADEPLCKIIIGGKKADTKNAEAGTGYFKQTWQAHEMDKKMAKITVANPNDHISYGAVYRQYFEDLDKVVAADNKIQIEKKMYLPGRGDDGKNVLREITPDTEVHPGDKVTVRFVIRTDRDLDYVHLKDMRAAGFEPTNVISRTKFQDGMYYYESTKDASENFFIEHLNKGTYVFEYQLIAVHVGDFSNGIATIQCMYAPEFTAHSSGMRFKIVK